MEWSAKAKEILEKIRSYREDKDGWKLSKKSPEVTVWVKSSPHWNGMLYKVEGELDAEPAVVFSYIEPSPNSPRIKWDRAIKELQLVQQVDSTVSVIRTITHSAFGGLISSRDFIDLCVTEKNDDYFATNAEAVDHPDNPSSSDFVRGKNYPCAIICYKVPGDPNKTRINSYIQTDLGGMLPKSLVENALPSNQVDFITALRKALQDGGHWKGAMNGSG